MNKKKQTESNWGKGFLSAIVISIVLLFVGSFNANAQGKYLVIAFPFLLLIPFLFFKRSQNI